MTQPSVAPNETPLAQPAHRLPPTAMAASLVALLAFFVTSRDLLLLPILTLALLATYGFSYRIPNRSVLPWILRFALFGFILFAESDAGVGNGVNTLLDARTVNLFGLMCAAELAIQCWKERPDGGNRGGAAILLSGLIFLAGCNTYQDYIRYYAPVYMLFIALTLSGYRPRGPAVAGNNRRTANTLVRGSLALLGLLIGSVMLGLFTHFRSELMGLGARSIGNRYSGTMTGLSAQPELGATFGMHGSPNRVLRIEGPIGDSHLRAMAFDTYGGKLWRPSGQNRERDFQPVSLDELNAKGAGKRTHVTRLQDNEILVFSPLNVVGIDVGSEAQTEWNQRFGGPVQTDLNGPTDYTYIVNGDEYHQGPLCQAPGPVERERLLTVAWRDINPRVNLLAHQIVGKTTDPLQMTQAVAAYLMTHHHYSLWYTPGRGDPLSNFILSNKGAHCEYFASAAAILLRCVGVPTRYVIGYYAHETEGPNVTVVRSQDAHAWAESWIDGLGWVTVDATPGDGRPDHLNPPTPWLMRTLEKLTDGIASVRAWLSTLTTRQLGELMTFMAFLMVVPTLVRLLFAPRNRVAGPAQFVISDAEMARLAQRFETVLKRARQPCPPGRPWSEHLARLERAPAAERPGLDWNAADAFVRLYNALRFGAADREPVVRELDRQIKTLEQSAQAAVPKAAVPPNAP